MAGTRQGAMERVGEPQPPAAPGPANFDSGLFAGLGRYGAELWTALGTDGRRLGDDGARKMAPQSVTRLRTDHGG